jgi:hypothetical protein
MQYNYSIDIDTEAHPVRFSELEGGWDGFLGRKESLWK